MVERGLLTLVMTHSFRLYGPGIFSEPKDKRPNAERKDIPIALMDWEIPRASGTLGQKWRQT